MIQLKHKFIKIKSVSIFKSLIFYLDRENIMYCSNVKTLESLWKTDALKGAKRIFHGFFSENFYYKPFSEGVAKINIKNGDVMIIANGFDFIAGHNKTLKQLLFNYPESKYILFDFTTESSLWEISSTKVKGIGYQVFGNYLFRCSKSIITNLNFENGTIRWQIDLNSGNWGHDFLVNSVDIITVLNDRVYIAVNSRYIFVMSVEKGEKLKTLSKIPNGKTWSLFNKTYDFLPFSNLIYLPEYNTIVSLYFTYYWEINTINDSISFWDLTNKFNAIPVRAATDDHIASWSVHHDGKLYFVSIIFDKETKTRDVRIACFDLTSREIVDTYKFTDDQNVDLKSSTLAISDNWLKISTRGGTTFIFELKDSLIA